MCQSVHSDSRYYNLETLLVYYKDLCLGLPTQTFTLLRMVYTTLKAKLNSSVKRTYGATTEK